MYFAILYKILSATLEYEINVPVRLLIFEIFSHQYALISDGMFIEIEIFQNLNLQTFEKYPKIKELLGCLLWKVMIRTGLLNVIVRYFH